MREWGSVSKTIVFETAEDKGSNSLPALIFLLLEHLVNDIKVAIEKVAIGARFSFSHRGSSEEVSLMTEEQQQRINEAADQFTNALVESFRTVTAHGEAAQEQGAQLTQEFFNRVMENLRAQTEGTREMTQTLAEQQQRAQEAGRTLTQESVNAYMDFVNSMFSFWQTRRSGS